MTAQTQPYIGSERQFRLYELFLRDIVNNWPNITIFDPDHSNITVETLGTRIRMARDSLKQNNWRPTVINCDKFNSIADDITVSLNHTKGKVVCGPLEAIRKPQVKEVNSEVVTTQPDVNVMVGVGLKVINPEPNVIHALGLLHHHQHLTQPTVIVTKNYKVNEVLANYDVAVQVEGDTYTIL